MRHARPRPRPFELLRGRPQQVFILVVEPALCQQLVDAASSGGLALVASLGTGLLMAPPSRDCLLEMSPASAGCGIRSQLWLEFEHALLHMRGALLQGGHGIPPPTEEELKSMEPQQLVARYVAMQ
mmetsp:Transcript_13248/g.42734  ORF Transcript_13248/g.42734 Transcript_13248/m.42734 type:complete len:126 (+) Transcript_13248:1515-1892(+)